MALHMEYNVVNYEEEQLENDSLSDESSRVRDEPRSDTRRRGSYTLDTCSDMNANLTKAIYTNQDGSPESRSTRPGGKVTMTQSLYERPSSNKLLLSAVTKKREEKAKSAKEDQEWKQKLRISGLSDSERAAENMQRRKKSELMKKIEENKKKAGERQRIVDERKERLKIAEEARRKILLRKLINHTEKKASPQSSKSMMTMSCYGGFGGPQSRHGLKEVVKNRFLNSRPVSSTGKIIGFGSSTPRPICETTSKPHADAKKIPDATLLRCELLSRPNPSRMSDKMTTSVIAPQHMTTMAAKKPLRQISLRERPIPNRVSKQLPMSTSVIEVPPGGKSKYHSHDKSVLKVESIFSAKSSQKSTAPITKKIVDTKRPNILENRSSSSSSNQASKGKESSIQRSVIQSKSATFPRIARKTKVDSHLDSDSIDDEVVIVHKTIKSPRSIIASQRSHHSDSNRSRVHIVEQATVSTNEELNSLLESTRAPPTKDLSESEYKTRLMENRRLVREKRERERDELMKKEREKRHADEIVARELMEMEREKHNYAEETHLTTSNDDALEGANDHHRDKEEEDSHLSEIPEVTVAEKESNVVVMVSPPQGVQGGDDEKNERKKKLESIMSRVRKVNDDSSSEGGVSPRRAMSPEPAELEPDTNTATSNPAFRSSLLQSMMNKGRLTKTPMVTKDTRLESASEVPLLSKLNENVDNPLPSSLLLTSVRESVEDSESLTSPSPSVTSAPHTDVTCKQDIEFEIDGELVKHKLAIQGLIREDCDGKEDSLSLDETTSHFDHYQGKVIKQANSSISSADTEEEEISKVPSNFNSVYIPSNMNTIIQEGCVFEN